MNPNPPPAVVLDTNAVLDWLLFADAQAAAIGAAVEAGRMRWVASARMREEFSRTLAYPALLARVGDPGALRARFDRWAEPQPDPPPAPLHLRCDDADDQVFIDLALAMRARWLVTRDKALLRLRRRAATAGLWIGPPQAWQFDINSV